MSKAPSPKADQLRALGDAKRERLNSKPRKLIPYAGKDKSQGAVMMGVKNRKAKT